MSSIGAASENQEVIKALKDLESDMQVLLSQLAVDPSLKKYIQENNSMARDLVLEQYEKRIASSGTEVSSILLNSSETESCPKIGDSQAFPPLKKAILQGKGPVAEVREDYSLKAREDSVTVNFNSVTNPAMEVVTTAMKKENFLNKVIILQSLDEGLCLMNHQITNYWNITNQLKLEVKKW